MILLVLGVYIHLTEIPGNLLRGEQVGRGIMTILVFATGCGLGLVTFSKILNWLLKHHRPITMAILCGFMFGSLRKLWPFQRDLSPEIEKIKYKVFEPYFPEDITAQLLGVLAVFLLAVGFVWLVDWFTHGHLRRLIR
jgi:putative membrane protein